MCRGSTEQSEVIRGNEGEMGTGSGWCAATLTPRDSPVPILSLCSTEEVLELGRRQDRMLDGFVPKVILNSARIVPRIGQRVATGMPQHVDVNREAKQLI